MLVALVPVVALVALLGPAVLAEPVIVVQPLKPTVPEPLPDKECSVEPIFKKAVPQAL